jgi:hypothetical protein
MKRFIYYILLLVVNYTAYANDGAYYTSGNHLIPINETDISIKKEILTIKRIKNGQLEVTVYYEFFNPKEEKKITVGFEAFSPSGDVDTRPKNGRHPYMNDFKVNLNNEILDYKVALVIDSNYVKNGKVNSTSLTKIKERDYEFYYVYHFEAKFKKGINIIKHTYKYDVSNSITYQYDIDYVLTAAKRWANKQIDDFTLIIEPGEFEVFMIDKTFFDSSKEWNINGIGRAEDLTAETNRNTEKNYAKFYLQKGKIVFHKKDFKINGDLSLYARSFHSSFYEHFEYIPYSYYPTDSYPEPKNDLERKILMNFPFARRGYIFKNQALADFYKKMDWYLPNPNYEANLDSLTPQERKWLAHWKSLILIAN